MICEEFAVTSCSLQTHLLIHDHAAVAPGEGGQQDSGGQLGGESAPQGGEACRQLGKGGGGRGGGLYQPSQATHLQNQEVSSCTPEAVSHVQSVL